MPNLSIRILLSPTDAIGPGKIALLESIDATGSISAAGRAMKMSYRRAWLLVDELNSLFRDPVAATVQGGRAGGGAKLTPFGKRVVEGYRQMERDATKAVAPYLTMVGGAKPSRRASARKRAK